MQCNPQRLGATADPHAARADTFEQQSNEKHAHFFGHAKNTLHTFRKQTSGK